MQKKAIWEEDCAATELAAGLAWQQDWVQILHVLNNLSSVEQAVEETDQQILVGS